jgi:hypothetical protein
VKILFKTIAAAVVIATFAAPAYARSKAYCQSYARQVANNQAAGKTVVGAGVGCLLGAVVVGKCGVGALAGGATGFAIGSTEWRRVYDRAYWNCRHS